MENGRISDLMDAGEKTARILLASILFLAAIGFAVFGILVQIASISAVGTILAILGAAVRRRVRVDD